ncbi:gsp-2 [Symbiodinium microadriaticum]|nr:gsp-2 [Symbiodinium microadriaticum]CAE7697879.1 gsp-2 [Symbiodinium sp. KB8]
MKGHRLLAIAAPAAGMLVGNRREQRQTPGFSHVHCWGWNTGVGESMSPTALWQDFGVKRAHYSRATQKLVLTGSPSALRPGTADDLQRVRNMKGDVITEAENPGLRVEPNFLDESEEEALARELRAVVEAHGFCFEEEKISVSVVDAAGQLQEDYGKNRSRRVTGRPESRGAQKGIVAPWGYGADLDVKKLPPLIGKLVQRLQEERGYKLGPLRDCTINHRTDSFFMIHPHVDPVADGPHVFLLGILSGAVLTFTPSDAQPRNGLETESKSWTDRDLDLLIRRRSLVVFSGPARYDWKHGIRAGFQLQSPELEGKTICDFWGSMKYILPRRPERFSVVLAFADPV